MFCLTNRKIILNPNFERDSSSLTEIGTKKIPRIYQQQMLNISTMQVAIKLFLYSTSQKWLLIHVVRPAFLKRNHLRRVTKVREVNTQAGKTLKYEA